MSEKTVAEIGEFALIDAIRERLSFTQNKITENKFSENKITENKKVSVGIGDDCAVVSAKGEKTVACVDVLSQGVHFRLDWSSANEVGRKAAAANLADIFAMGAVPTALLVGLALPETTEIKWVLELADGLAREAAKVDVQVVGGDIVRSQTITISVTALGELGSQTPILRSGAKAGDTIAVAGKLGYSAAGLLMLSRGFRSPKALVSAHRAPQPPYELAALARNATSMIDVSDGLLSDLSHIAIASKVRMNLESSKLPISEELIATASAFNCNAIDWVLNGGEDHAFLATFSSALDVPSGWLIIGTVEGLNIVEKVNIVERENTVAEDQPAVYLDNEKVIPAGWDHFQK